MDDGEWCDLLDAHDRRLRAELERHGGREINTAGDGFLAAFSTASAAARCATRLHREMAAIGLQLRAGIHCGEVEHRTEGLGGIALHIASPRLPQAHRPRRPCSS